MWARWSDGLAYIDRKVSVQCSSNIDNRAPQIHFLSLNERTCDEWWSRSEDSNRHEDQKVYEEGGYKLMDHF
jgi:hypothetical protein